MVMTDLRSRPLPQPKPTGRAVIREAGDVGKQVRALLEESMRLHRGANPIRGQRRDWKAAEPSLRKAYDLRKQALALDPKRESVAWSDPAVVGPLRPGLHESFMNFYSGLFDNGNGGGRG